MKKLFSFLLSFVLIFNAIQVLAQNQPPEIAADIEKRLARLPKTAIDYDKSLLNDTEKQVAERLIESSRYIDAIYWLQVSPNNLNLRAQLEQAAKTSKNYQNALTLFDAMRGKWDRLALNEPFIAPFGEAGKKPQGAGFYPVDLTKEEFDQWIAAHPEDKLALQQLTTVVVRDAKGLKAVPYSLYYEKYLLPAAEKLREAASISQNPSLKNYLIKRAEAFVSNDYFQSDMAWMDLDDSVEPVIGPCFLYEDGLFNFKTAFLSFILAVDKAESEKLKVYSTHLCDMELNLPIPDQYKNTNRSFASPIRVVQEIFAAGDGRKPAIAVAFILPTDDKARAAKGTKKIIIKNVAEAKFHKIGERIAQRVLDHTQTISFDAYFTHALFHELSHGLGPSVIIGPDGKKAEHRIYLKELYAPIEECKSDVLSMWNLIYAIDQHILTSFDKNTLYSTYVGLMFRIMRHGIDEAHGRGTAVQWSWLREQGAIEQTEEGLYKPNAEKMYAGIKSLATELLLIQATGDYARATKLLEKYGRSTKEIEAIKQKLIDIPVDINPVFVAAGEKY